MNLFIGPNGHGKTNLLDAISLGCQLRPIRPIKQNADLIQFGAPEARIETTFDFGTVSVQINSEGKKVRVNSKATRDSNVLADKVALVSFVPEDLGAITGGAAQRRRLLDQIAASLFPNYVLYYRQYERVLLQRNRLLKQPLIDLVELDSFTQVLAGAGGIIEKARLQALELIRPRFAGSLEALSASKLSSELVYRPSSQGDLKLSLERMKNEERIRKTTLLGPHLDDMEISINDHASRYTASRGQARILVLALKIAQLQTVFLHRGLVPILLLDDVVGELDQNHAMQLLRAVEHLKAQTFITTTHLEALPTDWQSNNIFSIFDGNLVGNRN